MTERSRHIQSELQELPLLPCQDLRRGRPRPDPQVTAEALHERHHLPQPQPPKHGEYYQLLLSSQLSTKSIELLQSHIIDARERLNFYLICL